MENEIKDLKARVADLENEVELLAGIIFRAMDKDRLDDLIETDFTEGIPHTRKKPIEVH